MSVGIRGAHHRIALVLTLLAVCGLASRATAQDSTRARSATLARVLAAAADDYRTGQAVYFVATLTFPEYVVGAFSTANEAIRVARDSGAGYGMFGPWVTPRDTTPMRDEIVGVTLTVRRGVALERLEILPTDVDALFFTRSAGQRFLVPYYRGIYGPAYGDELWIAIDTLGGGTCHAPGTRACRVVRGLPTLVLPAIVRRR